nr:uncharacterized protein LOC117834254 [Setaria viridis]
MDPLEIEHPIEHFGRSGDQYLGIARRADTNHLDIEDLDSHQGNSFVYGLFDDAESISVSGPSSPLQQIPDVGKGPGETSTDDEISKLLDVYPRQLCFPFEPNKLIRCAVTLTNRTEYYVGVWITLSYPDRRLGFGFPIMCGNESFQDTFSYFSEMMDPHSTLAVPMTMKELQRLPLLNTGKFVVLMIVMRQKEHIEKLMKASNMESDLLNRAQELGAMVNRVVLTASIGDPACCQAVIANYKFMPKRTSFCDIQAITDVHPTKTWLLASQKGGSVSIWNYQTQLWKIDSSDPVTTMEGMKKAGYLCDDTQWHTMVTTNHLQTKDKNRALIWNLQTKECVHRLGLSGWDIYDMACHPTLPILATSHSDGSIVCLWDTRAYR